MNGDELISNERREQLGRFGISGDDHYRQNELTRAAICYLVASCVPAVIKAGEIPPSIPPESWPWTTAMFKPDYKNPIPNLIKAGALIAAEIDRLQRAEAGK